MSRFRTGRRPGRPRRLPALTAAAALLAAPAHGAPDTALDVSVLDRESRPVPDVAVVVTPAGPGARTPAPPAEPAVMNQIDREFTPHVLVVQTGSRVSFPNDDDVNHHVYSFSNPKSFELELYKGSPHPPLRFDRAGLVVLGCNIHDGMLGYILVVDTPYFAKTDAAGRARFAALPPGEYSVRAWTPRLRPDELPAGRRIRLGERTRRSLTIGIDERLLPPHESRDTSLTWSDY